MNDPINELFNSGNAVPASKLLQAYGALDYQLGNSDEAAINTSVDGRPAFVSLTKNNVNGKDPVSQKEKDFNAKRAAKYGDKMGWELEDSNKPISIDSTPNTDSQDRLSRTEYLKKKFQLDGLSWSSWTHNGNWHKTECVATKPKALLEAFGAKKVTKLEYHVSN